MSAGTNTGLHGGFFLACALLVLLTGCGGERTPDASGSEKAPSFPRVLGSEGRSLGRFHFPRGIDISPSGLLAISDKTGRIQILNLDGKGLIEWHMPKMDNGTPTGVVFDATDPTTETLLVADTHNSRIMRYSLDGGLMGTFGEYGSNPGQMIYPTDLAVDTEGHIYVTEYGQHDRILKFDRDGKFIEQWGDFGEDEGEFQRPLALIFVPPDRITVADSCNHRVQTFSLAGELLSVWGETGRAPGQFSYPYDIVLGNDGLLYVAEYGNNRIQCFAQDGKFMGSFGKPGREPGEFGTPWGIAAAPDGLLYIADTLNHRLQVLTTEMVRNAGS